MELEKVECIPDMIVLAVWVCDGLDEGLMVGGIVRIKLWIGIGDLDIKIGGSGVELSDWL